MTYAEELEQLGIAAIISLDLATRAIVIGLHDKASGETFGFRMDFAITTTKDHLEATIIQRAIHLRRVLDDQRHRFVCDSAQFMTEAFGRARVSPSQPSPGQTCAIGHQCFNQSSASRGRRPMLAMRSKQTAA